MIHLTKYACPDKNCKLYGKIEDVPIEFIWKHIFSKPKSRLEDIAIENQIIYEPWREAKPALTNIIVDFCREFAARISNQELDQNELNNHE